MLIPLDVLKIGDKFINLQDDVVYKVVSEPIDGMILCSDDDGFGELFNDFHLVRPFYHQIE